MSDQLTLPSSIFFWIDLTEWYIAASINPATATEVSSSLNSLFAFKAKISSYSTYMVANSFRQGCIYFKVYELF